MPLEVEPAQIAVVAFAALCVHAAKALRLYIVLFGGDFSFAEFFRMYIRTACASLFLPFKSGDIWRGLYAGNLIGSYVDGFVAVLLDRFTDTLALVTVALAVGLWSGLSPMAVYAVLGLFLATLVAAYLLFPQLRDYWNHFLIFNKRSDHALSGLRFLAGCDSAYRHVAATVKGRFVFLYALSLVAWGVEMAAMVLVMGDLSSSVVGAYLLDVLTGATNAYGTLYIAVCVALYASAEIVVGMRVSRCNES